MSANYDQLISELNDSINSQVKQVYSKLAGVTSLKSYNQDGQGDFPYWLTTGPQNSFNDLTYNWIDQVVKYLENHDAYANTSNTMVGQLATVVYPKLSYALNASDNQKLTNTQTATVAEGNNLVAQYTQNVGPIPATETSNLNYVTGQILTWGKKGEQLTLEDLKNSFDLSNELPNMPAGGSAVLPALTKWLNAASSTLSLQNAVSFGNAYINYLKSAVKSPNKATGISTLDPTNPSATPVVKPRWTVNENSNALLNSLQNKNKKVTLSIAASESNSTTTKLSINGSAGAEFGLDWLTFGVGGSASYNVYTANSSEASATVEISYPGVSTVTVKPMPAQLAGSGAEGWMDQTVLTQARANGNQLPPPQSGYVFSPALPGAMDLSADGNFGYLNTIVISDQPTIKITYQGGDSSVYESIFKQQSSWSVKLFGLFTIAKGSQSYYKAKVEQAASGSGFTVTIEPDGDQFTVPDSQKRANVLAAAATWPGDA
ncbi:hypothetical protein [Marinicella meishanensis]|uniref:hypothetical protein n=1 Tax=Marinicella meishanensis TaxID=2873263 RepID=UPI001CBF1094|nr:hypothetical protein [Marinicella sp. NBU2979]